MRRVENTPVWLHQIYNSRTCRSPAECGAFCSRRWERATAGIHQSTNKKPKSTRGVHVSDDRTRIEAPIAGNRLPTPLGSCGVTTKGVARPKTSMPPWINFVPSTCGGAGRAPPLPDRWNHRGEHRGRARGSSVRWETPRAGFAQCAARPQTSVAASRLHHMLARVLLIKCPLHGNRTGAAVLVLPDH